MKKNKLFGAGAAISALSLAAAVISLCFLPERIPLRWDMNGEISAYGSKFTILLLGVLPSAVYYGLGALRKIDPKKKNYAKFEQAYHIIRLSTSAFLFAMLLVTLSQSFAPNSLNISGFIMLLTGLMIGVFGNYMPKLRHNFFCGIRTPWTLASEKCWVKTHRFAGKVWVICGALIVLSSLLLQGVMLYYAFIAITLLLASLSFIYSYIVYVREHKEN